MTIPPRRHMTIAEYLAYERTSDGKHGYYAGEIFAMAGGSVQHNIIVANTIASLHGQLRRRECTVCPSDMRVHIPRTGLYTYPDVSVVCGQMYFQDSESDTLLNPTVIIEVLSPSTENYDRGKKFQNYRMLDTLREYVLIAQDSVHIEHYVRQMDYQWLLTEYDNEESIFELSSIVCTLTLVDVYEKIVLNSRE